MVAFFYISDSAQIDITFISDFREQSLGRLSESDRCPNDCSLKSDM